MGALKSQQRQAEGQEQRHDRDLAAWRAPDIKDEVSEARRELLFSLPLWTPAHYRDKSSSDLIRRCPDARGHVAGNHLAKQ